MCSRAELNYKFVSEFHSFLSFCTRVLSLSNLQLVSLDVKTEVVDGRLVQRHEQGVQREAGNQFKVLHGRLPLGQQPTLASN